MSWSSIIPAAATVGSSLIGASAASKAADAQTSAADKAAQMQWDMYQQNREDLAPYRTAGTNALAGMQAMLTDPNAYTKSPGYDFRLSEGVKALDRSAAARGMLNSGATGKALERYGQDYATQDYGNQWNRLASLAGTGQQATTTGVSNGTASASGIGSNYLAGGQARASGYAGTANAVNNGVSNLLYLYGRS